jgi:lysozyme
MAFDIERVKQQLKQDEGIVCEIYLDHLGYKTCGIGHLVLETDPEYDLEVGADVNEERVNELFAQDLDIVLEDCKKAFDDWDDFNFVVQEVLVNMMFNLGMTRLLKFKKMHAAIEAKDWQEAGIQMKDSKWFTQVGPRAGRLIERIRTIDS